MKVNNRKMRSNSKKKNELEDYYKSEGSMVKKGAWSPQEDQKLLRFLSSSNHNPLDRFVNWKSLPRIAGIDRDGKSCRLRWTNYLRPDITRGPFTIEEANIVVQLHALLGNRWSAIASKLPGRTDNDVKNFWNSQSRKQNTLITKEKPQPQPGSPKTRHMVEWENIRLETETRLSMESILNPFGYPVKISDPFLQLWQTEIGDSFRKMGHKQGLKTELSTSPDDYSSPMCGSGSGITGQVDNHMEYCNVKEEEQHMSIDSEETCSDTAMNMLLDSPTSA